MSVIEVGKRLSLNVIEKVDFGVYLGTKDEKVLLPKKQVPKDIEIGDAIEVFIYRDSEDRLISTTSMPTVMPGGLGLLKVKSVTKIGAFLEWGLEKDILLPYKQQSGTVEQGKSYLVTVYVDKSNRLCASMKIDKLLKVAEEYEKEDEVTGTVYEVSDRFGAFVAVDNRFYGLIPKREVFGIKEGDVVNARVTSVREDGKLNLSIVKKAYLQMEDDAKKVLEGIMEYDGELPYDDKATPETIKKDFNMSKAAFKRAVGRLFKEKKIEFVEGEIHLVRK